MAAKRARTSARMAGARMTDPGTRGGFTIIEVVLVLAIAGLIFLMVFIALPALQRSQRDTQRRNDLGRVTNAITQYQTNNNGRLPGISSCLSESMKVDADTGEVALPDTTKDPDGKSKAACNLIRNYLNGVKATKNEFVDPDGPAYGVVIASAKGFGLDGQTKDDYDYNIYIYTNATCKGEAVVESPNSRSYAVTYRLEGSGIYCQDNAGGAGTANSGDDAS